VDKSKSEDIQNPYRTGNIFGLSEEWCNRALSGKMLEDVLRKRMFFMDYKDAIELGLSVKYTP
jgi:hypothetical protein